MGWKHHTEHFAENIFFQHLNLIFRHILIFGNIFIENAIFTPFGANVFSIDF